MPEFRRALLSFLHCRSQPQSAPAFPRREIYCAGSALSTLKGILPDLRKILRKEIGTEKIQKLKEILMHFVHN